MAPMKNVMQTTALTVWTLKIATTTRISTLEVISRLLKRTHMEL